MSDMSVTAAEVPDGVWTPEFEDRADLSPRLRAVCKLVTQVFSRWFEDFQRLHTPLTRVQSFYVLVTGSVYLGVQGPRSDTDLVVVMPAVKGLQGAASVFDGEQGIPPYFRAQRGVARVAVVESRVPIVKLTTDDGCDADVSFAVVPREILADADVSPDGLAELALSPGWRDAESLRVVLGVLGTRALRRRVERCHHLASPATWRQAYAVLRECCRALGVLSGMCRLLSPTALACALLWALEQPRPPQQQQAAPPDARALVLAALDALCPPPAADGALQAVHIFDPFAEPSLDAHCSWKSYLSTESRGDAFLASGTVHPVLQDVLLSHQRSADQTLGARALHVWYPTLDQAAPECPTVLVTHSVGLAQYVQIYNALAACRRRVLAAPDADLLAATAAAAAPLYSGVGVLYQHTLYAVTILAHRHQALAVLALAQLVDDVAYDSRRSVHAVLWPRQFPGPEPGSVVMYLALRRVPGRDPDLRLDMLFHLRMLLTAAPIGGDLAHAVTIAPFNLTGCSDAERAWVQEAVLTYPDNVMPWPPSARTLDNARPSPASPAHHQLDDD